MAISFMGWRLAVNAGYDLHVIRGKPSRSVIDDLLYGEVVDDVSPPNWYAPSDPQVAADTKKDLFQFVTSFVTTETATTRSGFGITIDKATGVVTAGAPTGGVVVHNFVLFAQATLKNGNTMAQPVRVHIHDRVRRCWLTPPTLSVYRGSPNQRFTVLAEFETDGQPDPPLIGDLSRLPGITWSVKRSDGSTASGVTMGPTGEIKTTASTALGTLTVTATLPSDFGSKTGSATAEVVAGFDEQPQDHYQAWLRSGPGSSRLTDVPNILLISEGFEADQESDWDNLISGLIDDFGHRAFRPFDLFMSASSVNVWSLFLPSRQRGSSVLPELRILPTTPATGENIPRTRISKKVLDLQTAFEFFGLPVRGDALPSDPAAQKTAAAARVAEWNLLRGFTADKRLDATDAGVFALWKSWTDWAGRTLADERDTLLGLAFGTRPNVSSDSVARGAVYHPFRAQRSELDKLLAKVTDADGPLIGHVWVPKPSGSSRDEAGKDRSLVVALIGGGRSGGVEADRNVTSASIHTQSSIPLATVGDAATSLQVQILPHDMELSVMRGVPRVAVLQIATIVHELAHAFGVGDEYVEPDFIGPIPPSNSNRRFPNLTPESELISSTSNVGDKLDGSKLRWRWPRITTAAVLSEPPWFSTSSKNREIVIPLRKGDKLKFRNGDVVFLRRRPLRGVVGGKLVIAEPSIPLVVTSDLQVEEQIVVRTQDGADLDISAFPILPAFEPIVFTALPPPPYAAARNEKFALLTPLVVRDHITKTGLPLDRKDAGKCGDLDDAARASLTNIPPDAETPFWAKNQWVGAFDGGAQFPCGIYHPSPECLMRNATDAAKFCPVCRYILVDAVDPSLHGEIDGDYAPGYVEPK